MSTLLATLCSLYLCIRPRITTWGGARDSSVLDRACVQSVCEISRYSPGQHGDPLYPVYLLCIEQVYRTDLTLPCEGASLPLPPYRAPTHLPTYLPAFLPKPKPSQEPTTLPAAFRTREFPEGTGAYVES